MKTFQVLITAQNWSNLLSQPLTWKLSQKLYLARIKLFPRCTTFQTSQAARFRTSWRSSLHSCRILTSSARCQTLMGRTMMLSKLPSFISKKTTTHKDSLGFPKLDIFVPTRWVHSRKHCPSLWRVFIAWVSGSQATPFPLAQWSRTDFEDSSWAARSLSSCLCEFMALWDKKLGMRSIAVSRVWPLTGGVRRRTSETTLPPSSLAYAHVLVPLSYQIRLTVVVYNWKENHTGALDAPCFLTCYTRFPTFSIVLWLHLLSIRVRKTRYINLYVFYFSNATRKSPI